MLYIKACTFLSRLKKEMAFFPAASLILLSSAMVMVAQRQCKQNNLMSIVYIVLLIYVSQYM